MPTRQPASDSGVRAPGSLDCVPRGDPRDTAATITRLVDGIVRAVRAQRAISGELADDLSAALTTVLIEMGLGEEA